MQDRRAGPLAQKSLSPPNMVGFLCYLVLQLLPLGTGPLLGQYRPAPALVPSPQIRPGG